MRNVIFAEEQGELKSEKNKKTYTVYKHISPDGRVYIGITKNNPKKRWNSGSGYKNNSYFTNAIKKYGWENFKHEIIYENLSEEDAKNKEIDLIAKCKSNIRKYGFNISSGGESKSGTKISEEQRQAIIKANIGKIVSESTRKLLRNATLETWKNPEHVKHMREINTGIKNSQFGKKRTNEEKKIRGAKEIIQYDLNRNKINEFISLHDASEKTNIARASISCCCRGIYKQAGGYIWEFKK